MHTDAGIALLDLIVLLALLGVIALFIASIRLVYRDAYARGMDGSLIALLVFLTFPIGFFLWLLLRPKQSKDPF